MAHYLITGSSSGIGAALSKKITAKGYQVSGIARRQQRLKEMSQRDERFQGFIADVGDPAALMAAITNAKSNSGPIDVAILNAGIYQPQDGTKIDPAVYEHHMRINYLGVVNALAGLVPDMVTAGQGPYCNCIFSRRLARLTKICRLWPYQSSPDITGRVVVFRSGSPWC